MKPPVLASALLLVLYFFPPQAGATVRRYITGSSEYKVKENAFKENMDYPVGPMECSQRCGQWWEKD